MITDEIIDIISEQSGEVLNLHKNYIKEKICGLIDIWRMLGIISIL
ncbi:MAG: hypothetical protein WCS34_09405 [Bacteroidales bacterium]